MVAGRCQWIPSEWSILKRGVVGEIVGMQPGVTELAVLSPQKPGSIHTVDN
jgi:hypothetical protein